ncbi:MAG TPA: hypothetical protein ENH41_03435 [Candidatus Omnitrophica bacterium]|nr:hypothetical protein [Candidatus Omnitrophota bacterium]
MKSYYRKQLEKLHGRVSVKFISDNGETNWLNLNYESCQEIARTLSDLNAIEQIKVEGDEEVRKK